MSEAEDFASGWKSARGIVVELPSGNKVRMVRTMSMTTGLKSGSIPNPLRNILQEMMDKQLPSMPKNKANDPEVIRQMSDLMNRSICDAVISPKIVMPPDDANWDTWWPEEPGAISLVDVSMEDRLFIYRVAQGGTADLESFREEQKQYMASVEDGGKVSVPTKRASRSNGARKRASSMVH